MVSDSPPTAASPGLLLLLVDDDDMLRELMSAIFKSQGYRVMTASNGEDALRSLSHQRPDAIVLDWQMPIMTGEEFLTMPSVKALGAAVPILVCSAYEGSFPPEVQVLRKPFESATILARLLSMLRARTA